MSKKKRKTKAEKTLPKKHDFKVPVYKASEKIDRIVREERNEKVTVNPKVMADLKKVTQIILGMLVLLAIVTYLAYRTDFLSPLLSKLGVNY